MAGRIPQAFIDQLLDRVDIVDVIDSRLPLRKKGREFAACCPFHDEKTPSFYVSPAKQFYHCFGCGAHGSAIAFLMAYEHLDFREAVRQLAESSGLSLPDDEPGSSDASQRSLAPLFEAVAAAAEWYVRQLREHPERERIHAYLRQRGLDRDTVRHFGIGYAPPGWDNLSGALNQPQSVLEQAGLLVRNEQGRLYDRFRDRLIFPIRDRRGRPIAFGGRTLASDDGPKYLNSPETPLFHKGRELYGLFEARQANRELDRLLLVEGYMDVVSLARHGIGYAVATLGTATTPPHLEQLFRVVPEVVFCFDGDNAGRQAAWRALETALPLMQDGRQARFILLPQGEDPDTLVQREGAEAFAARIAQAPTLSQYLLRTLTEQTPPESIDSRARLVEQARPLLQRLPAGLFRKLLTDELARIARTEPEAIQAPAARPDSGQRQASRSQRSAANPRQRPSAMRRAITLLLHFPQFSVDACPPQEVRALDLPGSELLADLLSEALTHPNITTAGLLERWRDTPQARTLGQLLRDTPPLDEAGSRREFIDALGALQRQHREQRTQALLRLADQGDLDAAGLDELKALLQAGSHPGGH